MYETVETLDIAFILLNITSNAILFYGVDSHIPLNGIIVSELDSMPAFSSQLIFVP